ncbi:zf-TFIIB domain-containing protein [Colwellia sp. MEBiC06753]
MVESQCSACQHTVKGKVRHCPLCNGSMTVIQQNSTKQGNAKKCPRCAIPLTIHHYRNHELDKCEQCEGLWLQPDEFAVLTSEFDVYRDDTSNPAFSRPGLPKSEAYLPCANCQQMMSRRNFKSISGVLIDSCLHCGIWLDKDELQSIRNFIASGGLDRVQDKKLVSHELKMEMLDDRVSDLELMNKLMDKFNLKRIFFKGF